MSEETLKPCPFCGSTAIRLTRSGWLDAYYVVCEKCRARGGYSQDENCAVEGWNRRGQQADSFASWIASHPEDREFLRAEIALGIDKALKERRP
ncbi:MAG: Lar family restriction alleviation protein [Parcubacteria group bacterium]